MNEADLIVIYPRLFHVTDGGAWPSIQSHGLLSTSALLDLYGVMEPARSAFESERRARGMILQRPGWSDVLVRDQSPMSDRALLGCLTHGMTPRDWYRLLNGKVFFWTSERRLQRLLTARAGRDVAQLVLTIDTRSLVERYRDRILLSGMNTGATVAETAASRTADVPADRGVSLRRTPPHALSLRRPRRADRRQRRAGYYGPSRRRQPSGSGWRRPCLASCRSKRQYIGRVMTAPSTGSHDVLGKNLVVVFCGLNPSTEAATGHNFGSPSNRFWRAVHQAGFTPHRIAAFDDRTLLRFGCGITAAVARGTRRAAEVAPSEFVREAAAFERKIAHYGPRVIAFLGKAAYAAMSGRQSLDWGRQTETFGGATVWILPNPSGLNRAFTLEGLVTHYGLLRTAVADELPPFERE